MRAENSSRLLWRDTWTVFGVVTLLYAVASIVNHLRFGTSLDLAIFSQGVGQFAGVNPDGVAMKTPGQNIFGDHFHPIILLTVPLYWLWPHPASLLIAQAVALGATSAIVHRTIAEESNNRRESLWFAAAFGISVAVAAAAMYDFHELALGAPFAALFCRYYLRRRTAPAVLAALPLLLVKEDMAVFLLPIALLVFLKLNKLAGVLLGVGAVAWGALTTMVIIPALNPDGRFFYTPGGEGVSGVGTQLVPALLFPAFAVWTTLLLVASMNPLVVRSWLFLPALSSILFRAILPNWRYWVPWYHYSLLPMVFIAFAAVELWRGEPTWVPKLRKALCVLAAIAGPVTITLALTVPNRVDAANRVIDEVPAGARVAAPSDLVPHLVDHTVTSLVRPPKLVDGNFKPLPDLQWVIIDERTRTFGGADWVAQFQRTQLGDFHPVLADEGYVLYRRR